MPVQSSTTSSSSGLSAAVSGTTGTAFAWMAKASFSHNAVASFGLHIFSAALSLATAVILARLVGAANYGVYAVAMVYANVFAFIACLGFPQLIVRYEAQTGGADQKRTARNCLKTATIMSLVAGPALAIAGILAVGWIIPSASPQSQWAFTIGMVLVVPIAYQRLREATLIGRNQPVLSLMPERLVRPLAMLGSIALVFWGLALAADARAAVLAQSVAYIASIAAVLLLVTRTNATKAKATRGQFQPKLLKEALPFLLVGLTTLFATRLDIVMLAMLSDIKDVGHYRLASQVAAIVMMISIVAQTILSPRVARLAGENRLHQLVPQLPRLGFGLGVAACGLSVAVYFGFQLVLPWIGDAFSEATGVLALLLIAYSVIAFLSPALPLLLMAGHARSVAFANFASLALNLILNLILIPRIGGEGAAIATLTSVVALYVMYGLTAWVKTGRAD